MKRVKKRIHAILCKIEERNANTLHSFKTIALYDFFVDGINAEVEKNNIDIIIMGTKGATGFKGAVVGSNTGDVITKVKCPLLAIPEDALYKRNKGNRFSHRLPYDLRYEGLGYTYFHGSDE